MMEMVLESGPPGSPLHLKDLAYHGDRLRAGDPLRLQLVLLELKQVLMLRQWFLKKLDPRGNLMVPALRDLLPVCFPPCVCQETLLFASLFGQEV